MATAKKTTTKKAAPKAPAAKKAAPAPKAKTFTVGDVVKVGGNDHTVDIVRGDECLVKNKVSGIRKWVKLSDMEGV
jgi:hypothetical protein